MLFLRLYPIIWTKDTYVGQITTSWKGPILKNTVSLTFSQ